MPKTQRDWSNFAQEISNGVVSPSGNETISGSWVFSGNVSVTGAQTFTGNVSIAGALTITGAVTSGENINLTSAVYQVDGLQVVGARLSAVSDASAATASNPTAPTAYTAHAPGGGTPVLSVNETDLDTVAASLETLRDEVATYEIAISALITDVADIRTQLNTLLARQRTHGLIAT